MIGALEARTANLDSWANYALELMLGVLQSNHAEAAAAGELGLRDGAVLDPCYSLHFVLF